MIKIAKAAAAALFAICSLTANADVLNIDHSGTAPSSIDLQNLDRITFSGLQMTVSTKDGQLHTYNMGQINTIKVNDVTTHLLATAAAHCEESLEFTITNRRLTITSPSDSPLQAAAYSLTGHAAATASGIRIVTLDLCSQPRGIYLIIVNNSCYKLII